MVILLLRFLRFQESVDADGWERTLGEILDSLLAATITGLAIGLAYALLVPKRELDSIEVLQPRAIARVIETDARGSTTWAIRARTASYFARAILPVLKENALRTGRSIKIRVQLLDPSNATALDAYARFRSNHPGASAKWNAARVRTEILSTILAAAICRNEAPRLEIEIGFSPDFWVLSLDLSDDSAFITGQNRGEPALCIRRTSELFSGWVEEFDAGFSICRVVRPSVEGLTSRDLRRLSPATLGKMRTLFESIGFHGLQDPELREISNYMKRDHNYA
ncbi:hypothetical protein ACTMTJ_12660 [Phytohabitans sp. LJ34]|uniref:hypothetical protein n=1 Tax=Phytohabitans sp. LJ34 TaxID=3452217 RepID=UPI003F89C90C